MSKFTVGLIILAVALIISGALGIIAKRHS